MGDYTYEFQENLTTPQPTSVVLMSEATAKAIDMIYKKRLPHIPCQECPDFEANATASCPDSIKAVWAKPEHDCLRSDTALTVSSRLTGTAVRELEASDTL